MTVDGTRLSPAGIARRDTMRDELLRGVVRLHVGRRRRRRGVAALLLVGAAVVITLAMRFRPTVPSEQIAKRAVAPATPAAPASRLRFTRIETDPSLIDRYRVESAPSRVVRIDDAELAAFLANAGRPSGVVRIGDEVRLTGNVVDPPRRDGHAPDDHRDVPTL